MRRLPYRDRREAGRVLAAALQPYARDSRVLVLALPRGGVEVGYEVASALAAPLDVLVVRKLGTPGQPELAMGAIASGGACVLNPDIIRIQAIGEGSLEAVTQAERAELDRRERLYRGARPPLSQAAIRGRVVILVDDGLATGATMAAAIQAIRQMHPQKVVCAVPVAAPDVCEAIGRDVDDMVCAATPEPFFGVGRWYERFDATTDDQVRELLSKAANCSCD